MRIVHYGLRSSALAALRESTVNVSRSAGIVLELQAVPSRLVLSELSHNATLVVIDLEQVALSQALALVDQVHHVNAFAHVVIVETLLNSVRDQHYLFQLGKLPNTELVRSDAVDHPMLWQSIVDQACDTEVFRRYERTVRQLVPNDARGRLILDVARCSHLATVKAVSDLLYGGTAPSIEAKRSDLWARCKRLGIRFPEHVLDTTRLLRLKTLIDESTWKPEVIAKHMSFSTLDNCSRSCRKRYNMSYKGIEKLPAGIVWLACSDAFWDNRKIDLKSVAPNHLIFNEDVPLLN